MFNEVYYKCLPRKVNKRGHYTLKTVQPEHIERIRLWRNQQINVLRQSKPISKKEQIEYYEEYVWSELTSHTPSQILLSYKYKKKLIGYGGLVNISWQDKMAEMSFLINGSRHHNKEIYHRDMTNFIYLIKNLCFDQLSFNRLFTETYEFRHFHIEILNENEFREESRVRRHSCIENKYHDLILHSIIRNDFAQ